MEYVDGTRQFQKDEALLMEYNGMLCIYVALWEGWKEILQGDKAGRGYILQLKYLVHKLA
jgi:hypothetical protein